MRNERQLPPRVRPRRITQPGSISNAVWLGNYRPRGSRDLGRTRRRQNPHIAGFECHEVRVAASVASPIKDQIEVLAPGGAGILGSVPSPVDPGARDGRDEALVEVGIFAKKRPLAVAEGHLEDA